MTATTLASTLLAGALLAGAAPTSNCKEQCIEIAIEIANVCERSAKPGTKNVGCFPSALEQVKPCEAACEARKKQRSGK